MQSFSVQNSRPSILALTLYAENSAEICAVLRATTQIFLLDYANGLKDRGNHTRSTLYLQHFFVLYKVLYVN